MGGALRGLPLLVTLGLPPAFLLLHVIGRGSGGWASVFIRLGITLSRRPGFSFLLLSGISGGSGDCSFVEAHVSGQSACLNPGQFGRSLSSRAFVL